MHVVHYTVQDVVDEIEIGGDPAVQARTCVFPATRRININDSNDGVAIDHQRAAAVTLKGAKKSLSLLEIAEV